MIAVKKTERIKNDVLKRGKMRIEIVCFYISSINVKRANLTIGPLTY